jgi:hypothetical protein
MKRLVVFGLILLFPAVGMSQKDANKKGKEKYIIQGVESSSSGVGESATWVYYIGITVYESFDSKEIEVVVNPHTLEHPTHQDEVSKIIKELMLKEQAFKSLPDVLNMIQTKGLELQVFETVSMDGKKLRHQLIFRAGNQ